MTISAFLGLLAVLVLLAVNAFFVAAEFALVAVERARVEDEAAAGGRRAGEASRVLKSLSFHLSAAQLGITLSSLLLGFLTEPTIAALLDPLIGGLFGENSLGVSIVIGLVVATMAQMTLGELIPKILALESPHTYSLQLAGPLRIFGLVFRPAIMLLNGVANQLVRRLGVEPREELSAARTPEELELMVREGGATGELAQEDVQLLTRSIRFARKDAADVLVPRGDVHYLGPQATVSELVSATANTGYSRFPVCDDGDLDAVTGVVHIKAALTVPRDRRNEITVADIMDAPLVLPETIELDELLETARRRADHMVLVADEYGGIAGIATVEDVVEELVGEIDDETDHRGVDELTVVEAPGSVVISAGLHPDEVVEEAGFEMPDGPYETIAGFLLSGFGHIPTEGEVLRHDGWTFEVVEMERLRIAKVRVVAPAELLAVPREPQP